MFAANDLGLSSLTKEKRLRFSVPAVEIDHLALVSHLAWSDNVPDDTAIARIQLQLTDGNALELPVRAGRDTSEWAYDRPDIRARIRHRRATVASSYQVNDAQVNYDAHTFVTAITLPEAVKVTGGVIAILPDSRWPDLSISVFRLSLVNQREGKTYALGRDLVNINETPEAKADSSPARWKLVAQTKYVNIHENGRAMPRVWLASETRVLNEAAMLDVIRSDRFADGTKWDPSTTALIESPLSEEVRPGAPGEAQITQYEPNRITVSTKAGGPSILVLSENHYPGWRAYIDGRAVETLRVDYNLRGVSLPAGQHLVEFSYRPKSVLIGMAMSLFAVALLSSGILIDRKYKSLLL